MTIVGTKMVRENKTARQLFEEVMANPARKKFGFGEKLAIVNVDFQQAYTRIDMFKTAYETDPRQIEYTNTISRLARERGMPVIWSRVGYKDDAGDAGVEAGLGLALGLAGADSENSAQCAVVGGRGRRDQQVGYGHNRRRLRDRVRQCTGKSKDRGWPRRRIGVRDRRRYGPGWLRFRRWRQRQGRGEQHDRQDRW